MRPYLSCQGVGLGWVKGCPEIELFPGLIVEMGRLPVCSLLTIMLPLSYHMALSKLAETHLNVHSLCEFGLVFGP